MLPIEEHGFTLHKDAFRDALCLCYGWLPSGLPAKCVCGHGFTVDHAMNCASGGLPTLCHNELRDFTTAALSEVWQLSQCFNPYLFTANVEDDAWMSVYKDFGETVIKILSLMQEFLIPLLLVIITQQFLLYIKGMSMTNSVSMSSM